MTRFLEKHKYSQRGVRIEEKALKRPVDKKLKVDPIAVHSLALKMTFNIDGVYVLFKTLTCCEFF